MKHRAHSTAEKVVAATLLLIAFVAILLFATHDDGPPDAKTYSELNELILDVNDAGVDCLLPFDTSSGTDEYSLESAYCQDGTVGMFLFEDAFDAYAYVQSTALPYLRGPNWVVISESPATIKRLKSEIGGLTE